MTNAQGTRHIQGLDMDVLTCCEWCNLDFRSCLQLNEAGEEGISGGPHGSTWIRIGCSQVEGINSCRWGLDSCLLFVFSLMFLERKKKGTTKSQWTSFPILEYESPPTPSTDNHSHHVDL